MTEYVTITRTPKQLDADELDLMVYRTISRLLQFADDYKDKDISHDGDGYRQHAPSHP